MPETKRLPLIKTLMLLLVFTLSLFSPSAFGDDVPFPSDLSPEQVQTLQSLMRITPALEAFHKSTGAYPGPTDTFVPLAELVQSTSGLGTSDLPLTDGWGQAILVWSNTRAMAILITGPDGKPARDYTKSSLSAGASGDDEFIILGQIKKDAPIITPEIAAQQRRRAVAEMRALGTALEMLRADGKTLPVTGKAAIPVSDIKQLLVPSYLRYLSSPTDPWGRPYYLWSDGSDYRLFSYGLDGTADSPAPLNQLKGGRASAAPGQDIVFSQGHFLYTEAPVKTTHP